MLCVCCFCWWRHWICSTSCTNEAVLAAEAMKSQLAMCKCCSIEGQNASNDVQRCTDSHQHMEKVATWANTSQSPSDRAPRSWKRRLKREREEKQIYFTEKLHAQSLHDVSSCSRCTRQWRREDEGKVSHTKIREPEKSQQSATKPKPKT